MLNNPNRPCGGFLVYKSPTTSRHKLPIALRKSEPAPRHYPDSINNEFTL